MVAFVAHQFPHIDQFRWPAWFNVAFSCCTALAIVLVFKDRNVPSNGCSFSNGCKLSETRQRHISIQDAFVSLRLLAEYNDHIVILMEYLTI